MSRIRRTFLAVTAFAVAAAITLSSAHAASFETIRDRLYSGQSAMAVDLARAELAERPGDERMRFVLGTAQFLRAVEKLGQGLYKYGLSRDPGQTFGFGTLTFARMPVPLNPDPEPISYDKFRAQVAAFVGDLEEAEQTLANVEGRSVDLPLDLAKIRIDLDTDGSVSKTGDLLTAMGVLTGSSRSLPQSGVLVDFDGSDVYWLRGYSHVLMASGEFLLAHDWRAAFDATFHALFPASGLPSSALLPNMARTQERLREVERDMPEKPADMDWETWRETDAFKQSRKISDERRSLRQQADFGNLADLVAFIHLTRWPVVEPERMAKVLGHLEAVSALSRENWRHILAETDNLNEWLPGPAQRGIFAGMTVSQKQVDSWMMMLDELDAILAGRKLLPHWRLDGGINVRRFFLEPRTFDLVLMIQGSAVLPYIEQGELTTDETWTEIGRPFGRDFLLYAIWFN